MVDGGSNVEEEEDGGTAAAARALTGLLLVEEADAGSKAARRMISKVTERRNWSIRQQTSDREAGSGVDKEENLVVWQGTERGTIVRDYNVIFSFDRQVWSQRRWIV